MAYTSLIFSATSIPFIVVAIKKARRGDGLGFHYVVGVALTLIGLSICLFRLL